MEKVVQDHIIKLQSFGLINGKAQCHLKTGRKFLLWLLVSNNHNLITTESGVSGDLRATDHESHEIFLFKILKKDGFRASYLRVFFHEFIDCLREKDFEKEDNWVGEFKNLLMRSKVFN